MKATVNTTNRKLVAVIGVTGSIFFKEAGITGLVRLNSLSNEIARDVISKTLEELLEERSTSFTPVYEGDEVTIKF